MNEDHLAAGHWYTPFRARRLHFQQVACIGYKQDARLNVIIGSGHRRSTNEKTYDSIALDDLCIIYHVVHFYSQNPVETTTAPASHAGNQTNQTTTCVHIPQTCHPIALCTRTSVRLAPSSFVIVCITRTGFSMASISNCTPVIPRFLLLRTKLNGTHSTPTKTLKLKFSVARAARNMPSSSREKHWSRQRACGVSTSGADHQKRKVMMSGASVVRLLAVRKRLGRWSASQLLNRYRGIRPEAWAVRTRTRGRRR